MSALPSGMQMMLKAMGIDPQAIMQQVGQLGELVLAVKARLDAIDARLTRIEQALELENGSAGETSGRTRETPDVSGKNTSDAE